MPPKSRRSGNALGFFKNTAQPSTRRAVLIFENLLCVSVEMIHAQSGKKKSNNPKNRPREWESPKLDAQHGCGDASSASFVGQETSQKNEGPPQTLKEGGAAHKPHPQFLGEMQFRVT